MDPSNPRTLIAGMWQVEMHTWGEFSGGPGSGLWISHDGGDTWKRIRKHGLPEAPLGKIDVAIAPTNGQRIYALIQTRDQGSVWRSDDGGGEWKAINHQRALIGRAGYYIRLAVSPANDNEVYVANSSFHQSLDGGENFHEVRWGGDTHDIWIDPSNADRFVITDDGGLIITTVHGRGFHRVHAADRPDLPRRGRPPGAVLLLSQHAGRRQFPRPERRLRRRRDRLGSPHGRLRIGLHDARPDRSRDRLGHLLRQQGDALGCALAPGALGQPVDAHARLAAQRR